MRDWCIPNLTVVEPGSKEHDAPGGSLVAKDGGRQRGLEVVRVTRGTHNKSKAYIHSFTQSLKSFITSLHCISLIYERVIRWLVGLCITVAGKAKSILPDVGTEFSD